MTNSIGLITGIAKSAGRSFGAGALIMVSVGAWIALEPVVALSQSTPQATQAPLAGGARDVPTSARRRFTLPPDPVATQRLAEMRKSLDKITPVTDAMLHNPSPNDWLMWRRTYDSWGYSPLNQINRDNVKNLTVAWTLGLSDTGVYEFTPVVHDGIMFVWSHGETLEAIDARNGNLLWKYHHDMRPGFNPLNVFQGKRSLAIGGNKVIFPTTDMHIIALDMKTGAVVWDAATDDDHNPNGVRTYNGAPLIVNGKVIMGSSGCAAGGMTYSQTCFVSARELETGKELWRFNTLAQPGEPGDETWNNVPAEKRWGGSVWSIPSYDPELNLLFVGIGTPYPWSSIDRGTHDPVGGGHHGDGLYMNSTLALNPDTGKLVWYYQHLPNDDFDQDYAFERVIVPIIWQGTKYKALITLGKPGVFEVLDAKTGKFLLARDPGFQNIFSIDPKTGVKTQLLPTVLPTGVKRCPNNNGARNFMPGSYDPDTNRYYISLNDVCTGKSGETPDHMIALDTKTMELTMDMKSRAVQTSGKLTTAGGLLFSASGDRYVRAFDVRDGKVLWQTRVQDVPNTTPFTYMVDGKQYVAMIAGNPGIVGGGLARATAENIRPDESVVLWVWQLP
ncbi:MAG TPA: PQQ-binding-like beta-propeller repeat protein [Edaphobacter sp.]|nr:PQQ-binding-like beta-propeller repeat protein [Edaphobacter sp.]